MNKRSYKFAVIFNGLLLLSSLEIADAQQPRTADTFNRKAMETAVERRGSLRVSIKYKKEYGYKSDSTETGPTSCHAFSVSARQYSSGLQDRTYPVTAAPKMRESDGFYVCDYVVSELPLNVSIQARAYVGGERTRDDLETEPWLGASESQPPRGLRRFVTTTGTTVVTLTRDSPTASVNFEMVYSRRAARDQ